jgi:DNA-binding HxlR family transcriptional regulator
MHPKKSFGIECPVARTLECIGEWWSILILRDAFQGFTRFDDFQKSLRIAPNILSRRLLHLTEAGIFERRLYRERPPRCEYVLTARGRDLFPMVMAIFAWGNKHMAPRGETVLLAERETGRHLTPVVVDAELMMPLTLASVMLVAGPRATVKTHERLARVRSLRTNAPQIEG